MCNQECDGNRGRRLIDDGSSEDGNMVDGRKRHVAIIFVGLAPVSPKGNRLAVHVRVVSMRVKILEVQPSAEVIAEVPYWLTYDYPPEVSEKLKHQWGSDWKGQGQKWPLVESGKNPQKYIKYGAEDLDRMLGGFFEGKNLNEPKR